MTGFPKRSDQALVAKISALTKQLKQVAALSSNPTEIGGVLNRDSLTVQAVIQNWGFEAGTASWTGTNAAVATASNWASEGTYSLLVTVDSATGPWSASSPGVFLNPIQYASVNISADVYNPGAGPSSNLTLNAVTLVVSFYSGIYPFGTLLGSMASDSVSLTSGSTNTLEIVDITVPSGTTYYVVTVEDNETSGVATAIQIDNVNVTTGAGIVDGTTIIGAEYIQRNAYGAILWLAFTGGAMFWYEDTATATQGPLICSSAHGSGTDPLTSTGYPAGFAIFLGGTIQVIGSSGQMIEMLISGGNPEIAFNTGAAYEAQPGLINMGQGAIGGVNFMYVTLKAPQSTTNSEGSSIFLNSAPQSGSSFAAGGDLQYTDSGGTLHDIVTWGSSGATIAHPTAGQIAAFGSTGLRVTNPITSDNTAYRTERITLGLNGGNVGVGTTSYVQLGGSTSLGLGTYHIHGQVLIIPGQAAGYYFFTVSGPGGTMQLVCEETLYSSTTNVTTLGRTTTIPTFGSAFQGTTFSSTTEYAIVRFDGTAIVSSAGAVAMFASSVSNSDSFTVEGYATYMEINPV